MLNKEKRWFPNVDGLRFLAAILLVFFHCFSLYRETWGDFYENKWFQKIYYGLSNGNHVISLFFIISGFVLCARLLEEKNRTGKINFIAYFLRRIFRTWPLYFVIVIFGFWIFPLLPYGFETKHSFAYYLFFLSNFDEIRIGLTDSINFLTITWSLNIEEQFYLIYPLLFIFKKYVKHYLLSIFGILFLFSYYFQYVHLSQERIIYYHTFSVMCDMCFGVFLALLIEKRKVVDLFSAIPKGINSLVCLIGGILWLKADVAFQGNTLIFQHLFFELFLGYILLEQIFNTNSFWKADKWKMIRKGGEISYGIYLFHCIFIYYFHCIAKDFLFPNSFSIFLLYVVIVLFLTLLSAYLSYHFFEKKFIGLGKKWGTIFTKNK